MLLLVLVVPLFACTDPSSLPRQFVPAQSDFAERLRWRDLAGAQRHLATDQQDSFRTRMTALTELNITDVRLESAEFAPQGNRVVTWNAIEYYLFPSTTVKTLRYRQDWEYVDDDPQGPGEWVIVTPFPDFAAPAGANSE